MSNIALIFTVVGALFLISLLLFIVLDIAFDFGKMIVDALSVDADGTNMDDIDNGTD